MLAAHSQRLIRSCSPSGVRAASSVVGAAGESAAFPGPHRALNHAVHGLPPSATLAINEHSHAMQQAGTTVYKLGLGQSPFPVPEPMVAELRKHAAEKDYLPVKGLLALREAVAAAHSADHGIDVRADNVLIGPGSKELLYLIQLCYYGELVLPTPSWVSYGPQSTLAGRPHSWIPTRAADGWKLQPAAVDDTLTAGGPKPRIAVINYPSNPTGATYTADELEALAAAFRRHQVLVVSDEIYGGVTYSGSHTSLSTFYPEGTVVLDGVSKRLGAGGWRLGCFSFPSALSWLADAMAVAASETFTSVSAPTQYACVVAYTPEGRHALQPYLHASNRVLSLVADMVTAKLSAVPGVTVVPPSGGFYAFPLVDGCARVAALRQRLGGAFTSQAMVEALLADTGVAVLAGSHFGYDPSVAALRLAFVNFDGGPALEAVGALPPSASFGTTDGDAFLQQYCGGVVTAMDRMCAWLATDE